MIEIRRYTSKDKALWNEFVAHSKNATFLHNRDYMDYHSDRFTDYSLMAFDDGKLKALLPANIKEDIVYSHQGLTYGGWLMPLLHFNANTMMDIFQAMVVYFKEQGIKKFIYKAVPHIFHKYPAEEDLYALFRFGAREIITNISSTVCRDCEKLPYSKSSVGTTLSRAKKSGVVVRQSDDYAAFWKILTDNLVNKYGVKPVHTIDEIMLLQSRFPENIKLYMSYVGEEPAAGVVVYEHGNVIHLQYSSANELGAETRALGYLFHELIDRVYSDRRYIDFGISNEDDGRYLNSSLLETKSQFAARGIAYHIYQIDF